MSAMTATAPTRMFREAAEAPQRVAAMLAANAAAVADLAAQLRAAPPAALVTIARGSSDNAATYARYLVETRLEVLTASVAPSVASVFAARPEMAGVVALTISQSGRSPDLIAAAAAAQARGARLVAMVNDAASPLAEMADVLLPLHAGAEISVAATKSFVASLAAIAQLVCDWSEDAAMAAALARLPDALTQAWAADWGGTVAQLASARGLYVLGRGPGFGAAQELALKLKETCGIHAEAFSAAEVRHGPMALIGPDMPVIALVPDDAGRAGVEAAIAAVRAQGAPVLAVGGAGSAVALPATHPALVPIVQTQAVYRLVEALAAARGRDPDAPPHLAKVTQTR